MSNVFVSMKTTAVAGLLILTSVAMMAQSNAKRTDLAKKMNQTKLHAVAPGTFGGTGIMVNVEKNTVKIEYDCADGEISQPLKIDKNGYFKVDGYHKGPNVGPIRQDDQRKMQAVRYEGRILGDMMTLKATIMQTKESLGEFTLKRGRAPIMHRCA